MRTMRIRITVEGKGHAIGELDDRNPESASRIYDSLPIEGRALLWMKEVYFDIPLDLDYENPLIVPPLVTSPTGRPVMPCASSLDQHSPIHL